ncbi:MAG: hypothetical protein A3I05_03255 [Deltaproteobacteria bacterium RIFCSPLOWO2_02_FULL_44_10]|nr:MAG: hypothetical protein A3C46_02830 [Deltaproteobacteria bacterium RIFCSPHIGHO2_02_FULL_44_16]OGQ46191.1 MAG: hypothetical protein A3I05_03255 [Deltaproteobacteria bacterium RIFCSPLOWO2_02_FULL_44_10]
MSLFSFSSDDIYSIFVAVLFSIVGFAAWRYGRRSQSGRHMILGVVLMGYGYFVHNVWWSLGIGTLLVIFLFWP